MPQYGSYFSFNAIPTKHVMFYCADSSSTSSYNKHVHGSALCLAQAPEASEAFLSTERQRERERANIERTVCGGLR